MNPATIFNLSCDFANLVNIFAAEIGSDDIAAAVGPVKYFSSYFTYPTPNKSDIRLNPSLNGGVFFLLFGRLWR